MDAGPLYGVSFGLGGGGGWLMACLTDHLLVGWIFGLVLGLYFLPPPHPGASEI
jgi:hypothetical protein